MFYCVYEVAPVPSKQPFGEREKGNDRGQAETSFLLIECTITHRVRHCDTYSDPCMHAWWRGMACK